MIQTDMPTDADSGTAPKKPDSTDARIADLRLPLLTVLTVAILASQPALAQTTGTAFCGTDIAQTIKNLFTLIQFGGPLIGGVIALGTTVALPAVRRADLKKELKETRNQAVVWGIIAAPLGTAIVAFLLDNVVAGGASCGF
ncbi:hypothetical protein [Haloarcula montana]|uniref:hypothetical protein n=1 Tax=Haloarcula montana TaxID=3111776 RepID=UPI002D78E90E|nr:hypothetical protein [Haloarcula sp. GH36]